MSDAHRRYFGDLAADSHGTTDDRPPLVLLHGLSYDRRQWGPVLEELAVVDPGRRVLVFDLPGHGDSPRRESYDLGEVAAVVHRAVNDAGLDAPIMVGHSLGGALVTAYAATYPVRGVVNVDQPLLVGGFGDVLRRAEPVLRSPAYEQVWTSRSPACTSNCCCLLRGSWSGRPRPPARIFSSDTGTRSWSRPRKTSANAGRGRWTSSVRTASPIAT